MATEAARGSSGSRRTCAVLGRLRRDRVVDLLRARRSSPPRRSGSRPLVLLVSACSSSSSRSRTPRGRLRFRRQAAPRPSCAAPQRPRRLHDRLGAVPRLPDRDRALGALPAALLRRRARGRLGCGQAHGTRSSPWRDRRSSRPSGSSDALAAARRDPRRGARRARRRRCSSCSGSFRLLDPRADAAAFTSASGRAGTTSSSPCRSRCSRTPGSRRWRISPRRRAARASTCRVALLGDRPRRPRLRAIATSASSRSPAVHGTTQLGHQWLRAPLVGIAEALHGHARGSSAACAASSAFGRADPARGRDDRRPASPGSPTRSASTDAAARVRTPRPAHAHRPGGDRRRGRDRDRDPDDGSTPPPATRSSSSRACSGSACSLRSPPRSSRSSACACRAGPRPAVPRAARRSRCAAHSLPLPAIVGAPLTFAVWILAMITHPGARYAGPAGCLGRRRLPVRAPARAAGAARGRRVAGAVPPGPNQAGARADEAR